MARTVKRIILGEEHDFPDTGRIWTHVRTDGRYLVLGECVIEKDAVPAVAYRDASGGAIWIRPLAEFMDGRFV